jgi:hypothetical protein
VRISRVQRNAPTLDRLLGETHCLFRIRHPRKQYSLSVQRGGGMLHEIPTTLTSTGSQAVKPSTGPGDPHGRTTSDAYEAPRSQEALMRRRVSCPGQGVGTG